MGLLETLLSTNAFAENSAVCHLQVDRACYASDGIVPKDKSGWRNEAITGNKLHLHHRVVFIDTGKILKALVR